MRGDDPLARAAPVVTVIIACFNHAAFVRRALESVVAQSHPSVRVIITDDGSTDESVSVIRDYLGSVGVRADLIVNPSNRGLCATLNQALQRVPADTDFLAIMSADDWMEPHRFERQIDTFDRSGERVAAVHSNMFLVDESGRRTGARYHEGKGIEGDIFAQLIRKNSIAAPTVLLRWSVRRALGEFDESFWSEDLDTWLAVARDHEFAYCDEPLVNYRVHASSMTSVAGLERVREEVVRCLIKHASDRPDLESLVWRRIEDLIVVMYTAGRSPRSTRRDLVISLRRHPSLRGVAYLAASACGVSGLLVGRSVLFASNGPWRRRVQSNAVGGGSAPSG